MNEKLTDKLEKQLCEGINEEGTGGVFVIRNMNKSLKQVRKEFLNSRNG